MQLSFGHKKILRLPLPSTIHLSITLLLMALAAAGLLAQQIYEVRPGDTLSRIAAMHGTTVAQLSELNNITDPTIIRIGQKLKIPSNQQHHTAENLENTSTSGYTQYTVEKGDTIYGIARKLQISPAELMKANNLDTGSILKIGQRLQVPVVGREARPASGPEQPPQPTQPLTPEPTPSPTPSPTQTPPPIEQKQTAPTPRPLEHRVVAGDTLTSIAARYGVSAKAIAAANRIQLNSILRIGQVLRIPADENIAREIQTTPAPTPPPLPTPTQPPLQTPQPRPTAPPREPAPPAKKPTPQPPQPVSEHTVQPGEDITTIAEQYGLSVEQLRQWNNLPPGQFLRVGQRLRLTAPATQTPPQDQPPPEPTPTKEEKITVPATKVSDRARAAGPVTAEQPREKEKNPLSQIFRGDPPQTTFVYIRPVKDQIDRPRIKRGRWRYVVIHHSETPSGNAAIFDRFHRNVRKWENGLAYHFVIGNGRGSGDGQIEVGQRWKDQLHGGHLRSAALNDISIGICLVGSYNVERPTARQIAATIELVQYLRRLCGNPRLEFTIHRRINPTPTDCPGKLFPERMMFQRLR